MLAVAVWPVPPSVEVTAPVTLFTVPAAVPVTFTENVQDPAAATAPPARLTTELFGVAVTVPPQLPVKPLGVETTSPLGSVSLKPTPVRATVALLFWIMKLSEVEPFRATLGVPKVLLMVGGATTVMLALEVFPVPPSVEVTVTLLFFTPAVAPATCTETAQEELEAMVPLDRLTVPAPAPAVSVPPQVLVAPGVAATVRPAGSVSENAIPVRVTAVLGFEMLKLRVVVPPSGTVAAAKDLVIEGGLATDNMAVLLVVPVPPLVELTAPVVLDTWPCWVPVTFTTSVQVLPCAMLPPDRLMEVEFAAAVTVPLQVLVRPGVAATCSPPVRVSLKATPASATVLAAGLVRVKLNVVVPFNETLEAPKALLMVGGAITTMLAEAVDPVPPSVEVTAPVVLFWRPAAVPLTVTENVQGALAARVAPVRLTTPVPAVAVMVPPPQDPLSPLGEAIASPAGSVSLKPTPESATVVFMFEIVKLSEVEPFSGMLGAPKLLLMEGGETTVMPAVAVFPVPPSVEVTWTLLLLTPAVAPCTLIEIVQVVLTARTPADRLAEPAPATAVKVPPQLLLRLGVVATTRPLGKESVNATPCSITLEFGFWMVSVSVVVPFTGMVEAPKDLPITGGDPTVRPAVAVFPVPPLVEVTFPVVLVYEPEDAPVTVTLNWQGAPVATVAPASIIVTGAVTVKVPPHCELVPLATVRPVGRVSVNPTPVSEAGFPAGLVIVNVSNVVLFKEIGLGTNDLEITGGASTKTEAEAVKPVPPSFEVTALVVLFWVPAAVPVTFTEKVQGVLAARVAPDRLTTPVPAVAVMVPPPQDPVSPLGEAIASPAGNVSLKATPESATVVFRFEIVKLSEVEPFSGMLAATKLLLMVGGATTVMLAVPAVPVPPSVELACTLLFLTPAVVPCTLTETAHEPLFASVTPDRVTEVAAATGLNVPPQLLVAPGVAATTMPLGKLSVNPTLCSVTLELGFWMVKLSVVVVPFTGMVEAPKDLLITGGDATVRLAVAVFPVPPFVEVTFPVVLV